MTLDSLLNILLAVGVPGLMALCGGILAARSLRKEGQKNPEVWIWSGGFLCLFLVSVILAFVQQVRNTTQQHAQEEVAHQKEVQDTGTMKFMAGQLDSISKALGAYNSASDPKAILGIIKSMAAPTRAQVPDVPGIQTWTNKKLRDQVISFANDLRKASSDEMNAELVRAVNHQNAMRDAQAKDGGQINGPISQQVWQQSVVAMQSATNQLSLTIAQTYVGPAEEYHKELERRLGPQKPLTGAESTIVLWAPVPPFAYTTTNLNITAKVLDAMARELPN